MMIKLNEKKTKWGWEIESMDNLILALLGYTEFQTVAEGIIVEAVKEAYHKRPEWNNVEELVQYIAENYI